MNINKSKLSELQIALINTTIFFDLFSHPLTAYELWRYLNIEASFDEVRQELEILIQLGLISLKNGFYFLPTKESLVRIRQERYHFANRKLKIAFKAVRLFKLLPTVRFVALSNLIGRHNLRDGSDIDIFIIAKKNRIWITRLFCAGLMKILRRRPSPGKKRDKICLSFYIDEDHLDLSSLTDGPTDYYFHFWLAGLYPLYDMGAYYHRLMDKNNWLKLYMPNGDFLLNNKSYRELSKSWREKVLNNNFVYRFFNILEYWSQSFQLKIMPKNLKEKINMDTRVIIREGVLKLYLVDRRQEFRLRYEERVNQYFNE